MQLRVKSLRHTILLTVPEEATLSVLKAQLPVAEWTNKQFLHQSRIIPDTVSLSSLGVRQDSELMIVSTHNPVDAQVVFLSHMDFRFCHFCPYTTTIAELRQVCSQRLSSDLDSLHLYFNKELLPDQLLLSALGSRPAIEVVISRKQGRPTEGYYEMFIKELTGKTHCLRVNDSVTMREVKEILGEKEGVAHYTYRIIFAGKQLSDESTIASIGAGKDSTFHAVHRLR